jgi:hypothetical protein
MVAICNDVDLSAFVGQGYTYEREPQYGTTLTTMNGMDHSAKLRDRVKLTVPFIPVTLEKLTEILQLFPNEGSYVNWEYYDPFLGENRAVQMKYDTRSSELRCAHRNGTEWYSGLVVKLIER